MNIPRHEIVLLGVGHTNAHVLRMWSMQPLEDARLTCVSNYPFVTYSGMLPAVLAGLCSPEQMEIDLVRLCTSANARLIIDSTIGLDRSSQSLLFENRPPLPFDLLSIGIGSVPRLDIADGAGLLPSKPMQTFLDRLQTRLQSLRDSGGDRIRIAVVGGGAGGCEVALALPAACKRLAPDLNAEFSIITAAKSIGNGLRPKTARYLEEALAARGISMVTDFRVVAAHERKLVDTSGRTLECDLAIGATDASAPPLLSKLGLATNEGGFLRVRDTLQSVDCESIFVVGDTAAFDAQPIPKAGVYAVRQGPILWRNLVNSLASRPLERFRPQRDFLRLLSLGDGSAVGEYGQVTIRGRWVWRLKDWIDSRFMAMYQQAIVPPMRETNLSSHSSDTMRCTGCGGKIAGSVLSRALGRLDIPHHPQVELGLDCPDDAAIVRASQGSALTATVDFFVSPINDPYVFGRIAALHAASDLFAMGSRPIAALAMIALPPGPEQRVEDWLFEVLSGSLREFRKMGATLAGGHTIESQVFLAGFSMLGDRCGKKPRTKAGLRAGDQLILTKPLGTGILLAALQRAACRARWYSSLLQMMLTSNQRAAEWALEADVAAITDVTGFGLAGHLLEMLRASDCRAEIELASLPLLPGVRESLELKIESTLAPANRDIETEIGIPESARSRPEYKVMFDPQTCGGLLFAVPETTVQEIVKQLSNLQPVSACRIGTVLPALPSGPRMQIIA